MRVLTLGGTRFMGRLLVERLLARGDAVTILTRGTTPDPFGDAVTRRRADRFDRAAFERALHEGTWDAAVDFFGVSAAASASAVDCLRGRIELLVHVSSAAVYEPVERPHGRPFVEADFGAPLRRAASEQTSRYAFAKRAAEEVLWRAHREYRLPVTCLRPPFVQGPNDYTLRSWRYQLWLQSGQPVDLPGGGGQRVSLVFRDDVVAALLACVDAGRRIAGEAFNIAQPQTPSLRRYLEQMAAVLGVAPRFRTVPLADDDWHPYTTPASEDLVLDTSKAQRLLRWQPTEMASWLATTCHWFDGPDNAFAPPADPPWAD